MRGQFWCWLIKVYSFSLSWEYRSTFAFQKIFLSPIKLWFISTKLYHWVLSFLFLEHRAIFQDQILELVISVFQYSFIRFLDLVQLDFVQLTCKSILIRYTVLNIYLLFVIILQINYQPITIIKYPVSTIFKSY